MLGSIPEESILQQIRGAIEIQDDVRMGC